MADPYSRYLVDLGMDKPRQTQTADRIEDAKRLFGDIYGQVTWLAERLSEARILVNNDMCAKCQRMSLDACKLCWCQEAAKAIREGRHSK